MIIPFKITIERVVIVLLLVVLVFKSCGSGAGKDCVPVKVETTVEEKTVTTVDSTANSEIKNREPETIPVLETSTEVKRVQDVANLSEQERKEIKLVNRYLDTTRLKGAVIFSEILSEGRVLEHNQKVEIDHKQTTITRTETIVEQAGGLFISPGLDYSPLGGLEAVETTLTFIKGNLGGSLGPYYNFRRIPQGPVAGSLGLKVKIHIKL